VDATKFDTALSHTWFSTVCSDRWPRPPPAQRSASFYELHRDVKKILAEMY